MSGDSSHSDVILRESICVHAYLNGECCGIPLLFGDEGERGWVGPETSSVMVALRSDFVRGPDVGGLAASSSSPLSLFLIREGQS